MRIGNFSVATAAVAFVLLGVASIGRARADVKDFADVDEPARVPYQEMAVPPVSSTEMVFSVVAKGHRRRVTNVNCLFEMSQTIGASYVIAYDQAPPNETLLLPVPTVQQANLKDVIVSAQISMFTNAGQRPAVALFPNGANTLTSGWCVLSGYEIKL